MIKKVFFFFRWGKLGESQISTNEMRVIVVAVIVVVLRIMSQAMDDKRSNLVLVRIDLIEWK